MSIEQGTSHELEKPRNLLAKFLSSIAEKSLGVFHGILSYFTGSQK